MTTITRTHEQTPGRDKLMARITDHTGNEIFYGKLAAAEKRMKRLPAARTYQLSAEWV